MDQSNKSVKIAAGIAVVLMLAAFGWGAYNVSLKNSAEADRDLEKLKFETLLSEKLLLEKKLDANDEKLKNLKREAEALSGKVDEANQLASLKEGEANHLRKQLASGKKSYNDLAAQNREMETRLASMNQEIARLQDERLASAKELESLRTSIENMKRELALAHSAHYDQPLIETTRGKTDKLVAKARRTKKLKATVIIPATLKDVRFQVFDPSGKNLSSDEKIGTVAVKLKDTDNAVASNSVLPGTQTFKQAELTFIPKQKLAPGTYRIDVMSENLLVGTMQVRLR